MQQSRSSAGHPMPVERRPRRRPLDRTDEEVLQAIRAGDTRSFSILYQRYHRDARQFARSLVAATDVDDVVSESFAKMLRALSADKGPVDNPVRYLMVTVRTTAATLHSQRLRSMGAAERLHLQPAVEARELPTQDDDLIEAFRSLSRRWRQVIWWSEVEGLSPTEFGERLDLSPSAAAALSYRARRALREAYLAIVDQHEADDDPGDGNRGERA